MCYPYSSGSSYQLSTLPAVILLSLSLHSRPMTCWTNQARCSLDLNTQRPGRWPSSLTGRVSAPISRGTREPSELERTSQPVLGCKEEAQELHLPLLLRFSLPTLLSPHPQSQGPRLSGPGPVGPPAPHWATLGGSPGTVEGVTWAADAVEGSRKNRPRKSLEHKAEKEEKGPGSEGPQHLWLKGWSLAYASSQSYLLALL